MLREFYPIMARFVTLNARLRHTETLIRTCNSANLGNALFTNA